MLNSWPDSLLQQTERAVLVLVGGGHLLGVWPVREEPEASNLGMRQVGSPVALEVMGSPDPTMALLQPGSLIRILYVTRAKTQTLGF